ncbi:Methionine aminopeptidase 1B, chloroplastic [Homalodisca vitripennis]|nr:Methionine aminopeptidase 1B, chloroplastic [Homalodisca vitripennis]
MDSCHVALDKELQAIIAQAPEGEEARNGERLIQFASESLVTEVLIQPQLNTLIQCIRNLLSSFTKHRHIIHAGYTFAGTGSWVVQDGTFSLADLIDAFQETEVQRVLRAYENSVTVDIHCAPEGEWSTARLRRESFTKLCKVRVNPDDSPSPAANIQQFVDYLAPFVRPASVEQLLEPSDVVGNIRFSHPTLYVFPGGQGDAALFGINGFNMLVDGGFARKACFWDFARHLDRLDAVLMTRINNSNVNGLASVLRRKKISHVYPQIGHFFCNLQDRKQPTTPDDEKVRDPLLVSLLDEGEEMVQNLRHLQLKPHHCVRESVLEPINLYHKVGHGKLDMYVISPSKDSKELKEFLSKWHSNDISLFTSVTKKSGDKDISFPLQNLVSICALLVWQPANPEDTITRILFPGSTPQHKIFEGLEKLRSLDFMKQPVCTAKTLSPSSSTIGISTKVSKTKSTPAVIDKLLPGEGLTKPVPKAVSQTEPVAKQNVAKSATIPVSGDSKPKTTPAPVQKPPKPKQERIKPDNKTEVEKEIDTDVIMPSKQDKPTIISDQNKEKETVKLKGDKQKSETKSKKIEPKITSKVSERKATKSSSVEKKDSVKSSPTTPKKSVDSKINGVATKSEIIKSTAKVSNKTRTSPSATPAKSTKEENNRKVVESKAKAAVAAKSSAAKSAKKEEIIPKPKLDKKPAKKLSSSSPVKLPSKSFSPVKAASKTITKTKKETKKVKGEIEKGIITDSSTVSTPSTIDAELAITKEGKPEDTDKVEEKAIEKEGEKVEEKEKAEDDSNREIDEHIDTKEKAEEVSASEEVPSVDKLKEKQVDASEKEFSEKEEEDEILIIEKVEIEQYGEDSVHEQESLESHLPDEGEEEIQKLLRDEAESEKKKDEITRKESIHEKEEKDIPSVIDEIVVDDDAKQDVQSKELDVKKDDAGPTDLALNLSKEVIPDKVLTPENREQIEEEVQDIITSATDFVAKAKLEQSKESSELSAEGVGSDEQKTSGETKDLLSSPEKQNILSDRNLTDDDNKQDDTKDKSKELGDVKYGAEESQPDEKFSTTVESGATTAPTLPEDERIPLDEIKEGVEEKYDKEETKEKDVVIPQGRVDQPTTLPQVAVIPGGAFDVHTSHMLTRDIVKTPDEVADLPVHEEVDGVYEDEEFSREGSKSKDDLLNVVSGKKEQEKEEEKVQKTQTIPLKEELPPAPIEEIEIPKDVKADEEELKELKLIRQRLEDEDTTIDKAVVDYLASKDVTDKVDESSSDIGSKIRKDVDLPVDKMFVEEDLIHSTLKAPEVAELVLVTPDSAPDSPLHHIEEKKEIKSKTEESLILEAKSVDVHQHKDDDLSLDTKELKVPKEEGQKEKEDKIETDVNKDVVIESLQEIPKDSDENRIEKTTKELPQKQESPEILTEVDEVTLATVNEIKSTVDAPKTPPASPVLGVQERKESIEAIGAILETTKELDLNLANKQNGNQELSESKALSHDVEDDIRDKPISEDQKAEDITRQSELINKKTEKIQKIDSTSKEDEIGMKSSSAVSESNVGDKEESIKLLDESIQSQSGSIQHEDVTSSKPSESDDTANILKDIKLEKETFDKERMLKEDSQIHISSENIIKPLEKQDISKSESPILSEKGLEILDDTKDVIQLKQEKLESLQETQATIQVGGLIQIREENKKEISDREIVEGEEHQSPKSVSPAPSGKTEDVDEKPTLTSKSPPLTDDVIIKPPKDVNEIHTSVCVAPEKSDDKGTTQEIANVDISHVLDESVTEKTKDAESVSLEKDDVSKSVSPELLKKDEVPDESAKDITMQEETTASTAKRVSPIPCEKEDSRDTETIVLDGTKEISSLSTSPVPIDRDGTKDTKLHEVLTESIVQRTSPVPSDKDDSRDQESIVIDDKKEISPASTSPAPSEKESTKILEEPRESPAQRVSPVQSDQDSRDMERKDSDHKKEVSPLRTSPVPSDTDSIKDTKELHESTESTVQTISPTPIDKEDSKIIETKHLEDKMEISPPSTSPVPSDRDSITETKLQKVPTESTVQTISPVEIEKGDSRDVESKVTDDKKESSPLSTTPTPSDKESAKYTKILDELTESTVEKTDSITSDKKDSKDTETIILKDETAISSLHTSPLVSDKETDKDNKELSEEKLVATKSISPVPSDKSEENEKKDSDGKLQTTPTSTSPIPSTVDDIKGQSQIPPLSASPVTSDIDYSTERETEVLDDKKETSPLSKSPVLSEKESVKILTETTESTVLKTTQVISEKEESTDIKTKILEDKREISPVSTSPTPSEKESTKDTKILDELTEPTAQSVSPVPSEKEDSKDTDKTVLEDEKEKSPSRISPVPSDKDTEGIQLQEEPTASTVKKLTGSLESDKDDSKVVESKIIDDKKEISPRSISPALSEKESAKILEEPRDSSTQRVSPVQSDQEDSRDIERKESEHKKEVSPLRASPVPSDTDSIKDTKELHESTESTVQTISPTPIDKEDSKIIETKHLEDKMEISPPRTSPVPSDKESTKDTSAVGSPSPVPSIKDDGEDSTLLTEQTQVVSTKSITPVLSDKEDRVVDDKKPTTPGTTSPVPSDKGDSRESDRKDNEDKQTKLETSSSVSSDKESIKDTEIPADDKKPTTLEITRPIPSDKEDTRESDRKDHEDRRTELEPSSSVPGDNESIKGTEILAEDKKPTTPEMTSPIPSDKEEPIESGRKDTKTKIEDSSSVSSDKESIKDTDVLDKQKQTIQDGTTSVPSVKDDTKEIKIDEKVQTTSKSVSPVSCDIEEAKGIDVLDEPKQSITKSVSPVSSEKEDSVDVDTTVCEDKTEITAASISPIPSGKESVKDSVFISSTTDSLLGDKEAVNNIKDRDQEKQITAESMSSIASDIDAKHIIDSNEQNKATPKSISPLPSDKEDDKDSKSKSLDDRTDITSKTSVLDSSDKEGIKDIKHLDDEKQSTPKSTSPVPSSEVDTKTVTEEQKQTAPVSSSPIPIDEHKDSTPPQSVSPHASDKVDSKDVDGTLLDGPKEVSPKSLSPVPSDRGDDTDPNMKTIQENVQKSISPVPSEKSDVSEKEVLKTHDNILQKQLDVQNKTSGEEELKDIQTAKSEVFDVTQEKIKICTPILSKKSEIIESTSSVEVEVSEDLDVKGSVSPVSTESDKLHEKESKKKEDDTKDSTLESAKDDIYKTDSLQLTDTKKSEKDEAIFLDDTVDTAKCISAVSSEKEDSKLLEKSKDEVQKITSPSHSPEKHQKDHADESAEAKSIDIKQDDLKIVSELPSSTSEITHTEKQDTPKSVSPVPSEKDGSKIVKDVLVIEKEIDSVSVESSLVDQKLTHEETETGVSSEEKRDSTKICSDEKSTETKIEKYDTSMSVSPVPTEKISDDNKTGLKSEASTTEKADTELSEKQTDVVEKIGPLSILEQGKEKSKSPDSFDSSVRGADQKGSQDGAKGISKAVLDEIPKQTVHELDKASDAIEKGILETLQSEKDAESVKAETGEIASDAVQSIIDSNAVSTDKVPIAGLHKSDDKTLVFDDSKSSEKEGKSETQAKGIVTVPSTDKQTLEPLNGVPAAVISSVDVSSRHLVESAIENKDIKTEVAVKDDSDSTVPSTVVGSNVEFIEKSSLPDGDSKLKSDYETESNKCAQKLHSTDDKDGLKSVESSSMSSTKERTDSETSRKTDTLHTSKDEYSSSIHRMLVTGSSEDGGTEIELCSSSVTRMTTDSCDKHLGNVSHQIVSGDDQAKTSSSSSVVSEKQDTSSVQESDLPTSEKTIITTTHYTTSEGKTRPSESTKQGEVLKTITTTITKTYGDHSSTTIKTVEECVVEPTGERKPPSQEEGTAASELVKASKPSSETASSGGTSHTLKKELSDAGRSGTPASDMASEREFEGPSTPHSDISSGQVSRAATHVWGETSEGRPDSRHCDSDDDIPCSPMSVTSHIAQSPPQFDFDVHQHSKQGFYEESSKLKESAIPSAMTSSLYGSLPEEDPLEEYLKDNKQSSGESQMYSSMYVSKYGDDENQPYSSSEKGQFESMFSSKKEDIDFETAVKEHKSTRGEDLTTKYTNGGKTQTLAGKSEIDSKSIYSGASTNGHGKPHVNGKSSQPDSLEYQESQSSTSTTTTSVPQKAVTSQSLLSEVQISSSSTKASSEDKKDPIEGWGKPLGLPPPPKNLIDSPLSRSTLTLVWNPADEWGIPLGLPSPAPPPVKKDSMNGEIDTEITSTSNKTTPKKVARRNAENNKSASNTPVGKEASNKSKHPESPVKRASNKDSRSKPVTPVYMDLTYVPHHGNSHYTSVEFFKRVRARYYVFSGTEPSREVFNALLEAKQTWEDKDLEVTIIPTYDTDTLGYWVAENEDILAKYKIDLSPSASRCTINLQDHETSCSAYRLEF